MLPLPRIHERVRQRLRLPLKRNSTEEELSEDTLIFMEPRQHPVQKTLILDAKDHWQQIMTLKRIRNDEVALRVSEDFTRNSVIIA